MSKPAQQPDDPRLLTLVEAHCNGTATDAEFAELQQRLTDDAAARSFYLSYLSLESALEDYADQPARRWAAAPNPVDRAAGPPLGYRWLLVMLAAACVLVLAVFATMPRHDGSGDAETMTAAIGMLQGLEGRVTVANSRGEVRQAESGAAIHPGDTLRISESLGTATIRYADGTLLTLLGKSAATMSRGNPKVVTVHGGSLFASVAPQPAGQPMTITTLTDRLEVLGTKFNVHASDVGTELLVRQGRVRLTRIADGTSFDVAAGRRVATKANADPTTGEILPPPDDWSEDFENGLPQDWASGKLAVTGLPANTAAVQAVAVPEKEAGVFEIGTMASWNDGLFSIHGDSHLHFTFKMQNRDWFNVLILTKKENAETPTFAGNYLFDVHGALLPESGDWATITIPLKEFRPLPPSRGAFENAIPIQMLFSSANGGRGLVIDRIWVTRDGPGEVVVEAVHP